MKIEDVEVKVIKGDMTRFSQIKARCVISCETEEKVRDVCARALRSASARGLKSIVFDCRCNRFPCLAMAKIMAQEAFRYIREEKHVLKEINFVLSSDKDFILFQRTVLSYLDHILHKLTQGPFITVDTIIEVEGGIVLIQRSNPPFGWAIPGGFVDYGETLEVAAAREAKEETGLSVKNLKQMHTYSDPSRDPRFHTVTTVFICQAKGSPKAASDAQDARIVRRADWENMELAFDHKKVLGDYLKQKVKSGQIT